MSVKAVAKYEARKAAEAVRVHEQSCWPCHSGEPCETGIRLKDFAVRMSWQVDLLELSSDYVQDVLF